jgi:hypothetical protein
MAEMVVRTAKAESRTISELFREAFRAYRAQQVHTILAEMHEEGRRRDPMGYTPDDVERLIDEVRAETKRDKEMREK